VDSGADLSDDAQALAKWGVAAIGALQPGRFSDVPESTPFPEPILSQVEAAAKNLISGEYQISVDSNAPNLCALALDAAIPIWVGFFVDSAFESLGPTGVAQPPNQSDPNGGGHAVYLSAYRTASDNSFEFLLQNSWGPNWANSGAVWVSSAWLKATWTLWPMIVRVSE
jgi:hypothetical protein